MTAVFILTVSIFFLNILGSPNPNFTNRPDASFLPESPYDSGCLLIDCSSSGAGTGNFLHATFTADAGRDEATVSVGDSGGGVFIQDGDGRWTLAGVTYDVEANFRTSADGPSFFASIFDRRGLFEQNARGQWVQVPDSVAERGTIWQATRVSSYRGWIEVETSRPQATVWPHLFSSSSPAGPFSEHAAYAVDPSTGKITFKSNEQQLFFHLGPSTAIRSVKSSLGIVEVTY